MFRVLIIFGTRPEAIKLAPVIHRLRSDAGVELVVCVTAQHRTMLDQVLGFFEISPDVDLDIMRPDQSLPGLVAALTPRLSAVMDDCKPSLVLVQGDTTTAFVGALAAFYHQVGVAHVEAGLRTNDMYAPFPEEMNRRLISAIASLHFAPTESAAQALRAEGVPAEKIVVTGNTVVDALHYGLSRIESDQELGRELEQWFRRTIQRSEEVASGARRLVLITGHRRESFGEGLKRICQAIRELAHRYPEHVFVYPVHLNPNVQAPVRLMLGGLDNVLLMEPVEYPKMLFLAKRAYLIVTDSGGIQEEAPSLKVPVVVTREKTERAEAVQLGGSLLVGSDTEAIVGRVSELIENVEVHARMRMDANPYGDGQAAARIVEAIRERWGR